MHVISVRTLKEFWGQPGRNDSEQALRAWYFEAKQAQWKQFADVQKSYGTASWVGNDRIVFNIAGNKYRLVVRVNFDSQTAFIHFIGTHKEYMAIKDIQTI